jgi:hypothetical protein
MRRPSPQRQSGAVANLGRSATPVLRAFTPLRSRSVIADHLHADAARPARLEQHHWPQAAVSILPSTMERTGEHVSVRFGGNQ